MIQIFLITALLFTPPMLLHATPQEAYLRRFQAYQEWNKNLPLTPTPKFIRFIQEDTPLANKLRERWLYRLAEKKDWSTFLNFYRKSNQTALICYAEYAHYLTGRKQLALNASRAIWLTGHSLPPACNQLFESMRLDPAFDERFIEARIILALSENNPLLAIYLLRLFHTPRLNDVTQLEQITKNPLTISLLPHDAFHGYFYVFGLKRLVPQKTAAALTLWQLALQQNWLTEAQQQQFITYLAQYKAQQESNDAQLWFDKIKPAFYTNDLLERQIRLALKAMNWPRVEKLIHYYRDKTDPSWQYWLARAMEAQGKQEAAQTVYQTLSQNRHYYGFLASLRLHRPFEFEAEQASLNPHLIQPYVSITDQIIYLHQHQRKTEASQLINDFSSELPKDEKVSLIYWIANSLNWYGQSIALSNREDLKNQLALRFPLPYQHTIAEIANVYHLPEAFIYAVIRQESTFKSDIISPAGARGLMQLMPPTAKMVAKINHIPYHHPDQLFQSQLNIVLGSGYLNFLARHFQNHPLLMAAAYNAGPRQVLFWLKNHRLKDIDLWIETLPWKETRNYLKNVIAFYAVYQHQLKQKTSLDEVMQPINSTQ